MAMITMYQIWARPQPTDTETRWIKIGQIATGYTFRKACELASRQDNSFPEDQIAILPVEYLPLTMKLTGTAAGAVAASSWSRS